MDLNVGRSLARGEVVDLMTEARERTLLLVASVPPEALSRQHSPLMSPVVWDLGHIAHFEEVWLLEKLCEGGGDPGAPTSHRTGTEGLRGLFNPFENPRAARGELDLPELDDALEEMARVRGRVWRALEALELESESTLLRHGFVFRLVLQHEYQHNETILQALQLMEDEPYRPLRALPRRRADPTWVSRVGEMVRVPGGRYAVGTDDGSVAYDNERPQWQVEIPPFRIDRTPVTNGAYLEFVEAGGYQSREYWSEAGWRWVRDEEVEAPLFWRRASDGRWQSRSFGRVHDLDLTHPVTHVSFHEAEAFARFVGKRLPTELEWEVAARWDPEAGRNRLFPWGDRPVDPTLANLDALGFGTAPVGAFPDNVSASGCYGMIGDVWEWTSSHFQGYPGFRSFPYREYSEVFFGEEYRVLRGGSWATRPGAIRSTFRNWDFPIRRQIFAGFRCAGEDGS